jgi:hypothetical protein
MPEEIRQDFEDALLALIDLYRQRGIAKDDVISVIELQKMAIEETWETEE